MRNQQWHFGLHVEYAPNKLNEQHNFILLFRICEAFIHVCIYMFQTLEAETATKPTVSFMGTMPATVRMAFSYKLPNPAQAQLFRQ